MAKITRYQGNLKAFGSEALGNERTIFGDDSAIPVQSDDLTANFNAAFFRGWGHLQLGNKPPREWFNGLTFAATQTLAYLHQVGVPEWDDEQEYYEGSLANAGPGLLMSLATSVGESVEDTDFWAPVAAAEVATFTVLETLSPTVKGLKFTCAERGRAVYQVMQSGYVALPGDVTFANGRVGQLQLGVVNLLDWFGNDEAGFADALERLNESGSHLLLNSNQPLHLTGGTQHLVKGLLIKGTGCHTRGDYINGGFIHITGDSENPIYLSGAGILDGVGFYYPNQLTTITPNPYPYTVKIKNVGSDQTQNAEVVNCTFVNSYDCIDVAGDLPGNSAPAFIKINRNNACAINTFINHPYTLTECYFTNNKTTYAWWPESLGQPVREYINTNAVFMRIGQSAGSLIQGNFIFGMGVGLKFSLASSLTNVTGNTFDGCQIGVDLSDATQLASLNMVGNTFSCKNPITGATNCAAIYARFNQTVSGSIVFISHIDNTDGNLIDIERVSGNCFLRLNISGNYLTPGRNDPAGSYTGIRISDASNAMKVKIDGIFEDTVNSGTNRTAIDITGCEMVNIDGEFEDFDNGVVLTSVSSGSRYVVNGIFKSVTTELTESGTVAGQVLRGVIYSSDAPADQIAVASAATLQLPANTLGWYVVSGTTNITDINAKWPGRKVSLKFNGALTVTDGGNLKLNGDFVTTADDILELVSDGTNWFEISRSTN